MMRRRGFTLIEMLVVICILVALTALLIPVVSAVKRSARTARTREELNRIANAIQRYNADFGSYPGPFTNDQIDLNEVAINPATGASPWEITVGNGGSGSNVTMAENAALGLLGGIVPDGSGTGGAEFNVNYTFTAFGAVSPTPVSITSGSPGATSLPPVAVVAGTPNGTTIPVISTITQYPHYAAYLEVRNDELTRDSNGTGRFSDTDGRLANDSVIPELLDEYDSDRMPILYLRARQGATGVMSDVSGGFEKDLEPSPNPNYGNQVHYQYCLAQIAGYASVPIGIPQAGKYLNHGFYNSSGGNPGYVNPKAYPSSATLSDSGQVLAKNPYAGGICLNPYLPYFRADTYSPWASSTTSYSQVDYSPKCKDTFILISAGPDRIYGTSDDVTNMGGTQP